MATVDPAAQDNYIYNRLLKERIIWLGSEVRDENANAICSQLLLLSAENPEKDIYLYINSPGGSVTAGMAIYDTMQFIPNDVVTVATSLGTHCMVSKIAIPAVTEPPGELMYSQMSFSGSSAASSSSCAQIALAFSSRTSEPRKMMRSLSNRL